MTAERELLDSSKRLPNVEYNKKNPKNAMKLFARQLNLHLTQKQHKGLQAKSLRKCVSKEVNSG